MAGRKRNEVVGAGGLAALAGRLRRLRDDQGLTLRELAIKSGYSHASLSTAESGRRRPSWELLQAFVQSCGEDPARWRQLWELAGESAVRPVAAVDPGGAVDPAGAANPAAAANPTGAVNPAGAVDQAAAVDRTAAVDPAADVGATSTPGRSHLPSRSRLGVRNRRDMVVVGVLGVAVAVAAMVAWALRPTPAGDHPRAQVATTLKPPPPTPEPERRSGLVTLRPGQVVDLDSAAADWGVVQAPGTEADDVWFSDTDDSLHGNRNADIAVLPHGSVGTFDDCALEQDYGATLDPARILPGQLVCNITSDNRVALLRITDVQYDYRRTPDQVTFQVVVWVKPHKT